MRASRRRGRVLAVALTTALGALAGAQAFGASTASPAASPRLTANPVVVRPGSALTLRGSGFPRQARLTLLAGPRHRQAAHIGSAVTGSRGAFVATIRIRARSAAGTFIASACDDRCRVKASVRFRIAAP